MENYESRVFSSIGEGQEANVYASERNGRASDLVVKEYKRGIDETTSKLMESRYDSLRSLYGEIIPPQRFVNKKNEPGLYVLLQERVEPAERPNVMDYEAGELSSKTQQQLEKLVRTLTEQYRIYKQNKNIREAYTLLDFAKKDNFLVTKDGDIKYVDTGTLQEYSRLDNEAAGKMIEGPIALLKLVLGKSGEEIMSDPDCTEFTANFKRTCGSLGWPTDSKAFEDYLRNHIHNLKGEILS